MSSSKRVRLVFEVDLPEDVANKSPEDYAADVLHEELSSNTKTTEIFKEIKVIRPYTKAPGKSYGRRRKVDQPND